MERFNSPDDEERVDELVEMIDKLMAKGDGHLTIDVDESGEGLEVKTYRSTDCGTGAAKGACCQPTEDAIDNDED